MSLDLLTEPQVRGDHSTIDASISTISAEIPAIFLELEWRIPNNMTYLFNLFQNEKFTSLSCDKSTMALILKKIIINDIGNHCSASLSH